MLAGNPGHVLQLLDLVGGPENHRDSRYQNASLVPYGLILAERRGGVLTWCYILRATYSTTSAKELYIFWFNMYSLFSLRALLFHFSFMGSPSFLLLELNWTLW